MKKFEYSIIKCSPVLLEEKLNDAGSKGWQFKIMSMEQRVNAIANTMDQILVLIFEKEIDIPEKLN